MALNLFFKWFFIILTGGVAISSLLIPILNSGMLCFKTKQCKPLLDATAGQFVASQSLMKKDIEYIKNNPTMDYDIIQPFKDRVFRSFLVSLFFIGGLWWILDKIIGIGVSKEQKNFALRIVILFIVLVIAYLGNVLYSGFVLKKFDFMPFSGFVEFFKNFEIIVQTVGTYTGLGLNVTNTTGMIG